MAFQTIELDPWNPRRDLVQQAADALKAGKTVLMPTDASWVLACDAQDKAAVTRLAEMRERSDKARGADRELRTRPLSLICPGLSAVGTFTVMDQPQFRLVKRLLPGPYTILLPVSREVPRTLRDNRKTIGIRVPSDIISEAILQAHGAPVFATTARREDGELLTATSEVSGVLADVVDIVIETEAMVPGATTVIDATVEPPVVLRRGLGVLENHWEHDLIYEDA